jgi:secondary thiamine-phosphate synthase enzyme
VYSATIQVQAAYAPQLLDLTSYLQPEVQRSGITAGTLTAFCMHTSSALILNEDEPLLHHDLEAFLEEVASSHRRYLHDDLSQRQDDVEPDHGRNAHAHLKQMVLGASITMPIVEGRPWLGCWQHLFFLELDRVRPRTILLQLTGV